MSNNDEVPNSRLIVAAIPGKSKQRFAFLDEHHRYLRPELNFHKNIVLFMVVWVGLTWSSAIAQVNTTPNRSARTDKNSSGSQALRFDVVSIRPSQEDPHWFFGVLPTEYRAKAVPLWITIAKAYLPDALISKDRLLGAPAWVLNDSYDFVGKVAPSDLTEWKKLEERWNPTITNSMLQSMLQAALAERCKLVVHRVPGEAPGYALVIDKGGPNWKKLQKAKPDETIPSDAQRTPEGGWVVPIMPGGPSALYYYQTSMASLAASLVTLMGVPVENRTGLIGKFNFSLAKWEDEEMYSRMWDLKSLGLKAIPIRVPAEILVIDHVERPSPN